MKPRSDAVAVLEELSNALLTDVNCEPPSDAVRVDIEDETSEGVLKNLQKH